VSAIAICAGKGSPGASFVAVNLASTMAREQDVLLLDLDPSGGDVAAYLGLDPRRGMFPLMRLAGSSPTSVALLDEAERRHRLCVVGGFPDACSQTTADVLPSILQVARATKRLVIADIGRVSDTTARIAEVADLVLLVVRPDLVSVAGAERALRALTQAGIERHRPADISEVATALRSPVLASLPLDRRAARTALIAQVSVAKGRITRAICDLATAINGVLRANMDIAREEVVA
jgi:Flp pilus assembly CpaE family ATPase